MSTLAARWQQWRRQSQQQRYILPSKYGYLYSILIIILLLGAINYNNNLGYMLCFLLASLGLVTMLHSYRNMGYLTVNITATKPVFCGQTAQFELTINNLDSQSKSTISLAYKETASTKAFFSQFKGFTPLITVDEIQRENSVQRLLSKPTNQRGWCELNLLKMSSLYPLGLYTCWTILSQKAQILVYPEPTGKLNMPVESASNEQGKTAHDGQGDEDFVGLKAYRLGEPLHQIAWKAMAKDNVMRSKQFNEPKSQDLTLSWQHVSEITDIEKKLSQLCLWICEAEKRGNRYGLNIPGVEIAPAKGASHQHHCLAALALYHG